MLVADANSGVTGNGELFFQMNIGTTLKGQTPFSLWLDTEIKIDASDIEIYEWPVFDKHLIDYEVPFDEQRQLIPIVPWHSIEVLENKRKRDLLRFKEEYMAEKVDSSEQFYPSQMILVCVNTALENQETCMNKEGIHFMGVDVASINDFFSISIFEKVDGKYIQRFLKYLRGVELPDMQNYCDKLIDIWNRLKPG
jgi:hypothetical protein